MSKSKEIKLKNIADFVEKTEKSGSKDYSDCVKKCMNPYRDFYDDEEPDP